MVFPFLFSICAHFISFSKQTMGYPLMHRKSKNIGKVSNTIWQIFLWRGCGYFLKPPEVRNPCPLYGEIVALTDSSKSKVQFDLQKRWKKLFAGVTAVTVYCLKYYKVYSRFYSASLLSKLQLVKLRILYCSTLLWLRVPEIVDFGVSHQVLQILLALLLFLLTPKIWSHRTALQVKEPPWTPVIISISHTTYLRNRQPLFNSSSWVFLTYKSLSNTSTWKLNIITSVPKLFQGSPVEKVPISM